MTVAPVRVERLVCQAAERHPHRPALSGPTGMIDFAELERRAGELADRLRAMGAGDGRPVAVRMPRSVEHAVAILACWKTGSTCVPVDPTLPEHRVDSMLRATRAYLKISPGGRLDPVGGPDAIGDPDLAYVFFTSGSSAEPKAVGVPHDGIVNEARWTAEAFGLTERDRGSWLSSPGFAISRWELWSALAAGACVAVAGEGIEWSAVSTRDWLVRERVSWSVVVTSLGERLFGLEWPAEGALRLLVTGGEQLRKWPSALPFEVVNSYGVTETSGVRSVAWLPRTPPAGGLPTIGKAIANTRLYILDDELRPVPSGMIGELCVGGLGLAHGYLGQPELTAERFLPDPFEPAGSRMYRTGDLARVNAAGDIEFAGRRGGVTKIDGVRVDVAEVEAVLLTHPAVSAAAVRAHPDPAGTSKLVGYVVWQPDVALPAHELRSFLAQRLPRALVPTAFVAAPALPMLPSGKVDRARLPDPAPDNLIEDAFVGPADDVERQVHLAFQAGLGTRRPVGGHDDFFGIGGDSLGVSRVQVLLDKHFGVQLPMAVLFESRTPIRIAAAIRARLRAGAPAAAGSALRELVADEPPMVPLSGAQRRIWFAEEMSPGSTRYLEVITVRLTGAPDVGRLRAAVGTVVAQHPALRTAIVLNGPEVMRLRHPDVSWELTIADLPATSDRAVLADLDENGLLAPMDLGRAPLFRLRLYRETGAAVLVMVIHHVIWDGASAEVLLRSLAAAYDGATADVADRVPVEDGHDADDVTYWIGALAGASPVVWADPPVRTPSVDRVGVVDRQVPAELVTALRSLAATLGASPFMIGIACLALALRRYHSGGEVVLCTPVSIRPEPAADRIGLYVNLLPLRLALPGWLTGRRFVESVRRTCLDGWNHRFVPFERIVAETAQGPRHSAQAPYSQVMFEHNRFPDPIVTADSVRWQVDLLPSREPICDLIVSWNDKPTGWTMRVEHALARIDQGTAEDLADGMIAALEALADNPDAQLRTLPGHRSSDTPPVPTWRNTAGRDDRRLADWSGRPGGVRERVAGMWCAALGVRSVDDRANFFALGGNSMAAMRLVTMVRSALGLRIPVRAVFDTDSFAEFMALLLRDHVGPPTNEEE